MNEVKFSISMRDDLRIRPKAIINACKNIERIPITKGIGNEIVPIGFVKKARFNREQNQIEVVGCIFEPGFSFQQSKNGKEITITEVYV